MKLKAVRDFLQSQISHEMVTHFGCTDRRLLEEITDNWFNDQNNYDGRWRTISERVPQPGRVLDMAAGCGTFVLYGLRNGYDVWGVEPEAWKLEYFRRKIGASGYASEFCQRIIPATGEKLPFADDSFDLVTSYQTLEHVQNVKECLGEMLRVVKPGGILYLRAPDYNSFFEPHYRLPFLPCMNRKIASFYLRSLGRPESGLHHLNWTTERSVVRTLRECGYEIEVARTSHYDLESLRECARKKAPFLSGNRFLVDLLVAGHLLKYRVAKLTKVGREERVIDLWVGKVS